MITIIPKPNTPNSLSVNSSPIIALDTSFTICSISSSVSVVFGSSLITSLELINELLLIVVELLLSSLIWLIDDTGKLVSLFCCFNVILIVSFEGLSLIVLQRKLLR